MKELFSKIFGSVLNGEEDVSRIDRRLGKHMEEYISRYEGRFSVEDMDALKDCVYYAISLAEEESFCLGMKYTVRMLLFLLETS